MKNNKVKSLDQQRKLTWGEFKRLVESSGVKDGDEIDQIDISWGDINGLECYYDEDFGWQIRL